MKDFFLVQSGNDLSKVIFLEKILTVRWYNEALNSDYQYLKLAPFE